MGPRWSGRRSSAYATRGLGERMCVCVVLRAGAAATCDERSTWLRAMGLAIYKLPESLEILDALPSTAVREGCRSTRSCGR